MHFDLGRMQGIDLVFILRLLGADLLDQLERLGKGCLDVTACLVQCSDLAADITGQPTQLGAYFAQMPHSLLVPLAIDHQPGHLTGKPQV